MPVYRWDHVANNNGSADPGINYLENQAPSSLNDSARAAMSAMALYRDDISGALVTSGTSTAYILATNSNFTSAAFLGGQMVAFTPHITSGAAPTMTIDSIANIPLRSAPGVNLPAGVLIQGSPYVALFNNTNTELYLHGFYGNPYNIPLAAGMDYWAPTSPNSAFAFPIGQAISRLAYAPLFALIGTTYGAGDGTNTFNLPDKTGRASVMKEAAATRLTSTYFGGNSTLLGAVGGGESQALTEAQLAAHNHGGVTGAENALHTHNQEIPTSFVNITQGSASTFTNVWVGRGGVEATGGDNNNHAHAISTDGSGAAHNNVQPTIVTNYIMRVL
jgi:microcystin-dependent protein